MEITIKTYICPHCGYVQDRLLTPEEHGRVFSERAYAGLRLNQCPACYSGQTDLGMKRDSSLEVLDGVDLSSIGKKFLSDEEIYAIEVPEVSPEGLQVMVQTGDREVLAIENGKPVVVTEAVYEPKMRELTDQERTELKEQRDRNLEELEKLAA